jgi:hypothetical protein
MERLTKVRSDHERYWEAGLKKVGWEIDSPDILDALANDRPIEQVLSFFMV